MFRFLCYGKKTENLEASLVSKVIGSKQTTFIKKILLNDIIFFYVQGKIWGSARIASEGFESNERLWRNELYPYRFKIDNIKLIDSPFVFKDTEFCGMLRKEFGSHWGYKVLFTPSELPKDIGSQLNSLIEKESCVTDYSSEGIKNYFQRFQKK